MKNIELAIILKNIVFENEQRHSDVIDYDELVKEFKETLDMPVNCSCGVTADGTFYGVPMCEGCLHRNT